MQTEAKLLTAWELARDELEALLPRPTFLTIVDVLEPAVQGGTLVLYAPNDWIKEMIERRLIGHILKETEERGVRHTRIAVRNPA